MEALVLMSLHGLSAQVESHGPSLLHPYPEKRSSSFLREAGNTVTRQWASASSLFQKHQEALPPALPTTQRIPTSTGPKASSPIRNLSTPSNPRCSGSGARKESPQAKQDKFCRSFGLCFCTALQLIPRHQSAICMANRRHMA